MTYNPHFKVTILFNVKTKGKSYYDLSSGVVYNESDP